MTNGFKTGLGYDIFKAKYSQNQYEQWPDRAAAIVNDVCGSRDGKVHAIDSHLARHWTHR